MGGAIDRGNTGTKSEFNIELDPEAAERVFTSGLDVTMVPLEVTHTALATREVLERLSSIGPMKHAGGEAVGPFVRDLLTFFAETYRVVFNFESGPPLHDPCAVLYVAEPELFTTRFLNVHAECSGKYTAGATCVDVFGLTGEAPNVHVALKMDVPAFWDRIYKALYESAENGISAISNLTS